MPFLLIDPWSTYSTPLRERSSTKPTMVEVLERYSKLDQIQFPTEVRDYQSPNDQTPRPQSQRLDQRLTPEKIAEIVATYEAGAPTAELQQTYGLGKHSVLKVLHEAGAHVRHRGMGDAEIDEAIALYESGLSLAKVGARLGRRASVIRRALAGAGVTIRVGKGGL